MKNNKEQTTNISTIKETVSSPFKINHVQLEVVKEKFRFKSPFNRSETESSVTERNLFGIGINISGKKSASGGTAAFRSNPWSVNADSPSPPDSFTECIDPSSAIPDTHLIENKNKDEGLNNILYL